MITEAYAHELEAWLAQHGFIAQSDLPAQSESGDTHR
jgi:hypothetical protein